MPVQAEHTEYAGDMSEAELNQFYHRLLSIKSQTIAEHARIKEEINGSRDDASDPIDIASNMEERTLLFSRCSHIEKRLRQVNKALANFDDFGICMSCGGDIEYQRICAYPETTECLECQSISEKKVLRGA